MAMKSHALNGTCKGACHYIPCARTLNTVFRKPKQLMASLASSAGFIVEKFCRKKSAMRSQRSQREHFKNFGTHCTALLVDFKSGFMLMPKKVKYRKHKSGRMKG